MEKITLRNQLHTVEMSKLVLGENGITDPEKRDFIFRYMDDYLEQGGNCFDTARLYGEGKSEYALGEYISGKKREDIVIVSKCSHHALGIKNPPSRLTKEDIISDVETSLKALGTDYIDVLFLHRDDIKIHVSEIMPTLDKLITDGKVRILGASNWTAGRIDDANKFAVENNMTPFSINQISWSLALTTAAQTRDLTHVIMDNAEYTWHKENNFPAMAWSAAAKGFFSTVTSGGTLKPTPKQRYGFLQENYKRAERAEILSKKYNTSVGSIVLAYVMCSPFPGIAVTSFSNQKQFSEALDSVKIKLTKEDMAFLELG